MILIDFDSISKNRCNTKDDISIVLDGEEIGVMSFYEKAEFNIPQGKHSLFLRLNTFIANIKSNTIDFTYDGNNIEFDCCQNNNISLKQSINKEGFILKNKKYIHCGNCGVLTDDKSLSCINCGFIPKSAKKYCIDCGIETKKNQVTCVNCNVELLTIDKKSKIQTGLLAIFFGAFAAHKFYLGYKKEAISTLFVFWGGFFMYGIPTLIVALVIFVEGIIFLTKSDKDFQLYLAKHEDKWGLI